MSERRGDAGAGGGKETVTLDRLVARHFQLEHAGDKLAVKNDLKAVCTEMGIDVRAVPTARETELLAEYETRYCATQPPPHKVTGAVTSTGMPSALASTGMPTALASTQMQVTAPAQPEPGRVPVATAPQTGQGAELANLEEARRVLLEEYGIPLHGILAMMLAYRVFCLAGSGGEYRAVGESSERLDTSYIGRSVAAFVAKLGEFCAEGDYATLDDPIRSLDRDHLWDVTTKFREACYQS